MTTDDPSLFGSLEQRLALRAEADDFVTRALSMVRRARAIVEADRFATANLVSSRRTALAEHLHRYQRFKHARIFDPVIQHGTSASRIVARTLKIECVQMGEVFGGYHARWLRLNAREWPRYRSDMRDTIDILVAHLDAERDAIHKLLHLSDFYGGAAQPVAAAAG